MGTGVSIGAIIVLVILPLGCIAASVAACVFACAQNPSDSLLMNLTRFCKISRVAGDG